MKILRLSVAAALGLISAIAAADPYIICELATGVSPTAVASQYNVALRDATSDGSFAMYEVATPNQANVVANAMSSNSGILGVEIQSAAPAPPPATTNPNKGSTIPVVGDRATLQYENRQLLSLINWKPNLANSSGREVRVAVLDTGLGAANSGLWSKVVASRNFVESGMLAIDRPMATDSNNNGVLDEASGHGTMVAGIIDFVAPKTKLIVARVANSDGAAHAWNIVQGIRFAVEQGAEVINLSFGSEERNNTIGRAVAYAERKGVVVVAGIGNSSVSDAFYPAKFPSVIGVSAVGSNGVKAGFSNWSSKTQAAAPGFSIVSQYWDGELTQWSGTSFSAAFVSATVADCLRRRSRIDPFWVRLAVAESGSNINNANPNYRNKLGTLLDHDELDEWLTWLWFL
ncbi:MAG: S8 family peptidase [Fimbriimonas sp.]